MPYRARYVVKPLLCHEHLGPVVPPIVLLPRVTDVLHVGESKHVLREISPEIVLFGSLRHLLVDALKPEEVFAIKELIYFTLYTLGDPFIAFGFARSQLLDHFLGLLHWDIFHVF